MVRFVRMPILVVVEMMGQIKGGTKQSAIFKLVKIIVPDLCNVSSRGEMERSDSSNVGGSSENIVNARKLGFEE